MTIYVDLVISSQWQLNKTKWLNQQWNIANYFASFIHTEDLVDSSFIGYLNKSQDITPYVECCQTLFTTKWNLGSVF